MPYTLTVCIIIVFYEAGLGMHIGPSFHSSKSFFPHFSGGDSEVQRTMLELLNQLDGFEATKNIKIIMATSIISHISLEKLIQNKIF